MCAAFLFLGSWGCQTTDTQGQPCQEDATCGSGFDCFEGRCVAVCSPQEPCAPGFRCQRYRCLPQERVNEEYPPLPDSTQAELRAIRRELELLRAEVARLVALQGGVSLGAPALPPGDKGPRPVVPGALVAPRGPADGTLGAPP